MQFAIRCKNDAFVAEKVNTRLAKVFMAIFALAERLPTSARSQLVSELATRVTNDQTREPLTFRLDFIT